MDDRMRVSDADREHVTARLREHFAEGRLTSEELDERITATLNAKTFGDLRSIMTDLPEPGPAGPAGPTGPQPGQVPPPWATRPVYRYRRGPRLLPLALIVFFAALILPGAGWAFIGLFKVILLVWLIACVAGIFAAARFRRRMHRHWQSGHGEGDGEGSRWRQSGWRD
jgi:hypothetical protein